MGKRQHHRLRQLVERAKEKHERQSKMPSETDRHRYDDPRELAAVFKILMEDAPEALPEAGHDDFEDMSEEQREEFALLSAVGAMLHNGEEDPDRARRAAEGLAEILREYPDLIRLDRGDVAKFSDEELFELALQAVKEPAGWPFPPGEGPELPENTA